MSELVKAKLATVKKIYVIFFFILQGEIASVTFVGGNPRHSGDIVSTLVAVSVQYFYFCKTSCFMHEICLICGDYDIREIRHWSQWRGFTTTPTHGK